MSSPRSSSLDSFPSFPKSHLPVHHICVEGVDGVGKTTLVTNLVGFLRELGYNVARTSEPGTLALPLTRQLRSLMLDNAHEAEMTPMARELISQAARSVHVQRFLNPAKRSDPVPLDPVDGADSSLWKPAEIIIQDRGLLSGQAYALACGNDGRAVANLTSFALTGLTEQSESSIQAYDAILLLRTGNVAQKLVNAVQCKTEFRMGDAMESRGAEFQRIVARNMNSTVYDIQNGLSSNDRRCWTAKVALTVDVDGLNESEVFLVAVDTLFPESGERAQDMKKRLETLVSNRQWGIRKEMIDPMVRDQEEHFSYLNVDFYCSREELVSKMPFIAKLILTLKKR